MSALRHVVMPVSVLPHHCIGGMQAVAWDLARALVRARIAVTVLTAEIPKHPSAFEDEGVAIRALPGTYWRHYGSGWWTSTRRVFEKELIDRCDLVLSVSAGGFGLLPLRGRIPRVPFVMQAHGTSMGEVVSKWRSRSLRAMATSARNVAWIVKDCTAYPQFDAIVAVGDRVARDLAAWPTRYAVDRNRVHVIRNGIDTAVFHASPESRRRTRLELGWSEDQRVVISASRLHVQKGVALGLKAFALLAKDHPELRYLIVGDGPEMRALRVQTDALGLSESVHFTGSVPRQAIAAYLNAADVLLFTTTRIEGEPLNVLEALAVGLPAVVSEHIYPSSPPCDQVLLVKPTDSVAVATSLQRALEQRANRASGLPTEYSAAASIEQYLALFGDLMSRRARLAD